MWHSVNGKDYMFVTFMGGTGVDQPDGGSIGVFDPQSNAVIKIIEARKSKVAKGEPFIDVCARYIRVPGPHGRLLDGSP